MSERDDHTNDPGDERPPASAVGDRAATRPESEALRAQIAVLRHELGDLKDHLPDALVEGDIASERVTYMNRLACLVFGYTPEEATALHARDIFVEGDYERARQQMEQTLARGTAGGGPYRRTGQQDLREFRLRRRDGSTFPAETQSSIILDLSGRPVGVRTLVRDVTARKELEARLEEMSVRDPLTGCFNRRYLDRRRAELERPTASWVCLLFDLTDFKRVNDTYGHEEGDRVLQSFAHFLSRHHRSDDVLLRLGGDEFALFVRAHGEEEGRGISKRIVEAAARDSPAAFSLGTAFRRPGERVPDVLARADQVLYASKGRSLRPKRRRPAPEGRDRG
jgi:diguanylate cyclase (GGDEF)-like protein/PAS domain S-box-containing protein